MARNEKIQVLSLRKQGKSIGEIARSLGLSKSTVSFWCRDIRLTEKQLQQLDIRTKKIGAAALRRWVEKKRRDRIQNASELHTQGAREVGNFSKRDRFIAGLALYWGEGYKRGNEELGFTNSDPIMIKFFISWLKKIYGIPRNQLILRISINNLHSHRVKEVEKYWREVTQIPQSQFSKISLIKTVTKKSYPDETKHFGTLRIKVRKGTDLRRKILGSIEQLKKSI